MTDLLTVDSVMLAFGEKKVLTDVFMKFETGKITAIFGRNGSGKSSLMKIIIGILEADNKHLKLNDKKIDRAYLEHGLMNFLPQEDFVPGYIKLKTAFKVYGIEQEQFLIYFPEFEVLLNSRMRDLSGGERRLAETYMILKKEVKFVMLDEPFSYLMPLHVQGLKKIMLLERNNKGIIITDHMYRDVEDVSDKMYLLNNGKSHVIEGRESLVEFGYLSEKNNN